jgi:Na+/proline symporter
VAVIAIGLWVSRGVKDEAEYFVSGRSMGAWLQFFINFGQATDSNGAPTIATEVYRTGVGGMWIGFQTLLATPFIWFTSIWFRRTRLITGPDLFMDRFASRRLAIFYTLLSLLQIPVMLGLGNIISYKVAAATMIKPDSEQTPAERQELADYRELVKLRDQFGHGLLPAELRNRFDQLDSLEKRGELANTISYVRPLPFVLIYTGIVAAYILLGGIKAAAITDAFQGILIIIFSVMMIPIGLSKLGGFHGLHQVVPAAKFNLFGGAAGGEYTWYSITAIVLSSLLGFGNPGNASAAAGRDEHAIRLGTLGGLFCKRFVMIAWMLCGLLAAGLFGNRLADPDTAWGSLASSLLPVGLMGLMISGMLLGHMPAVGNNAVNFSAVFTRNFYEPLMPGRSSAHYLLVAKFATFLVLLAGALCSLYFTGVIPLLAALITFNAFFGVVGILIYFWRKLTAWAVGIGAVVWIVLMVVLSWIAPSFQSFRQAPALVMQTASYTEGGRIVPPTAIFFDRVALSDPSRPDSPLEGIGRFQVENYICYLMGIPMKQLGPAGLLTCRWAFDGIFPFAMLIALSYLTLSIPESRDIPEGADPNQPLSHDPFSTQSMVHLDSPDDRTDWRKRRALRIARFHAKMKTPVSADLQTDIAQVQESFRNSTRFDHLKLFPYSHWEFTRWDAADYAGFFGCWAGVLGVLLFLLFILRVGS